MGKNLAVKRNQMVENIYPKELAAFRDSLLSEVIKFEALTNLLDRNGIIDKEELLEEIKKIYMSLLEAKT